MRREDVETLLTLLGADAGGVHYRDGWVSCKCVLARWRHHGGVDSHPSMGIQVNDSRTSRWNCFGCSDGALPIPDLLVAMHHCSGVYPREAAEFYNSVEFASGGAEDEFPIVAGALWSVPRTTASVIPDWVLDGFPSVSNKSLLAVGLLRRRGVSVETARRYGVRVWPARKALVFPYTDQRGRVLFLRARRWDEEKTLFAVTGEMVGCEEAWSLDASGAWFGLGLADPSRPVLVVEGEYDALRLAELGAIGVIAAGGSNPTVTQLAAISARTVMLGWDADEAGEKAVRRTYASLKDTTALWMVRWSEVGRDDGGALQDKAELDKVMAAVEPL